MKLRAIALAFVGCLAISAKAGETEVANGPVHNGVEVQIDLPKSDLRENLPSDVDKAGLCVWTSIDMAALWMGIQELIGIRDVMRKEPGGGWPERVEKVIKAKAPHVDFVQYEGSDASILDATIKTGRPVCITYGYGDFYRKRGLAKISHMVLLVHLDSKWAAIRDNNDVEQITWMPREELLKRAMYPSGKFWSVSILGTPPPPIPRN